MVQNSNPTQRPAATSAFSKGISNNNGRTGARNDDFLVYEFLNSRGRFGAKDSDRDKYCMVLDCGNSDLSLLVSRIHDRCVYHGQCIGNHAPTNTDVAGSVELPRGQSIDRLVQGSYIILNPKGADKECYKLKEIYPVVLCGGIMRRA